MESDHRRSAHERTHNGTAPPDSTMHDWMRTIIRAQVRLRLVAWPGRQIGAQDEEDFVQQVFVALWDKDAAGLKAFDPKRGELKLYLRAFTRERLIEIERKFLRRRDIDNEGSTQPPPTASFETPEDWFQAREANDQIVEHLRTASGEDRKIFFLAFVKHLSNPEIAEKLNVSAAHVATRKCALRRRVQDHLGMLNDSAKAAKEESKS